MQTNYAMCRASATPFCAGGATSSALPQRAGSVKRRYMFDRYEFLERVLEKARSRQEVLDFLNLPSSRGPGLFNRNAKKPRYLMVEEAVKLSEKYGVPITGDTASAESLLAVLRVSLRYPPKEWTEQEMQRLAEELEFGLRLQRAVPGGLASQQMLPSEGVEEDAPLTSTRA